MRARPSVLSAMARFSSQTGYLHEFRPGASGSHGLKKEVTDDSPRGASFPAASGAVGSEAQGAKRFRRAFGRPVERSTTQTTGLTSMCTGWWALSPLLVPLPSVS